MARCLFLICLLSIMALGQSDKTPSDTVRTFLKAVEKGELESAEGHVYKLLVVDRKVFGSAETQPSSTALKSLYDSGYEYHKELSVETSKDISRVYVEVIRRLAEHTAVDLVEVLLIRSGAEWKINGWRNISTPIDRSRHLTVPHERPFVRPFIVPVMKPCPRCT